MGFLGPLLSAGASIVGSLFSAKSAKETNQSNADQAQAQMDFQERMSNTAHQREVADLEAAHLNPILSANSGASTPGGAMATFKNPLENVPSEVNQGVNSAMSAIQLKTDMDLKRAQVNNLNANSAKTAAETTEPQIKSDILNALRNAVTNSAKSVASSYRTIFDSDYRHSLDPDNARRANIQFDPQPV